MGPPFPTESKCPFKSALVLPSRVGGLPVLEDNARGHLLPHPVPRGLVKSQPILVALKMRGMLSLSYVVMSPILSLYFLSSSYPPLVEYPLDAGYLRFHVRRRLGPLLGERRHRGQVCGDVLEMPRSLQE